MDATCSLWHPPDNSDSETHRIGEVHVVSETDPARWRVQVLRSDMPVLPDSVTVCLCSCVEDLRQCLGRVSLCRFGVIENP